MVDLPALSALAALGTFPSEASLMSLPVSELFLTFAPVIELLLIFTLVTAFFLICLLPTEFFGRVAAAQLTPPRAMKSASVATTLA